LQTITTDPGCTSKSVPARSRLPGGPSQSRPPRPWPEKPVSGDTRSDPDHPVRASIYTLGCEAFRLHGRRFERKRGRGHGRRRGSRGRHGRNADRRHSHGRKSIGRSERPWRHGHHRCRSGQGRLPGDGRCPDEHGWPRHPSQAGALTDWTERLVPSTLPRRSGVYRSSPSWRGLLRLLLRWGLYCLQPRRTPGHLFPETWRLQLLDGGSDGP
jgi:hypothetical protein